MRGTYAVALAIAVVLGAACGGSASKLVKKGDQRLMQGNAPQALANYNAAIRSLQSNGKEVSKSLQISRDHAAALVDMKTLDEAQKLYSSKQYENALDTLWSLHKASAFGVGWMDDQLVKLMGDIVAKLWDEVDAFALDLQYDLAVLKAEYYVAPFPAGHAHRLRLEALYEEAATYHLGRMRQMKMQPAGAAFHYKMARRFGAPRSPDGEQAVTDYIALIDQLSRTGVTWQVAVYAAQNALAAGKPTKTEEYLVMAYGLAGSLPLQGQEWFGPAYGLGADGFHAIMTDTTLPIDEPTVAIATLPEPDNVSTYGSRNKDDRPSGSRWTGKSAFVPSMLFGNILAGHFGINGSALPQVGHTRGFGGTFRVREKEKFAFQMDLYFETAVIGGDGGGWGVEYRALKPAKDSLVFGYGFGYSSQEATEPAVLGDNPAPACQFQRSLYFPIFVATDLTSWLTIDATWRPNLLRAFGQADGEDGLNVGDKGHYSPFVLTFSTPLFSTYYLTGTVSYAPGAEREAYFGAYLNRAFLTDDD